MHQPGKTRSIMFVFNSTGGSRGVSSSLWVWRGGDGSLRHRGLTGGVSAEERNCFLLLQVVLLFGPVHLRHHTCPAGCLSPALNLGCNPACLHLDTMNGKESFLRQDYSPKEGTQERRLTFGLLPVGKVGEGESRPAKRTVRLLGAGLSVVKSTSGSREPALVSKEIFRDNTEPVLTCEMENYFLIIYSG